MTVALREDLLARLSDMVFERTGLSFSKDRLPDLERGLRLASRDLGFDDPESTLRWLLSSKPERRHTEILASYLTVGETYFFRHARAFQALKDHILPVLISSNRRERRLRLWSAGCCTGEEPYSLAILLHSLLPDFTEWNITILATDINPRFLRKANEAVYNDWSFRETSPAVRQRYFTRCSNGRYEILPFVRNAVTFEPLNLVDDSYPSFLTNTNAMDIILCRNVLMYFRPEAAERVVTKLFHSLVDEGWLLVSPSELSQTLFTEFTAVQLSGALCYCKTKKRRQENVFVPPARHEPFEPHPEELSIDERQVTERSALSLNPSLEETTSDQIPEPLDSMQRSYGYQDAIAEYDNGDLDSAEQRIRQLLHEEPHNPAFATLFARILAGKGNLKAAEEQCRKAIQSEKLDHTLRYLHATIARELGADDQAIRSLQESIFLNPDFPLSHFLLANLRLRHGEQREADKHFRWALELLERYSHDHLLPDSGGMTAGRLVEIIESIMETSGPK
jgi:chemotaxis protein methyltransferase CheR